MQVSVEQIGSLERKITISLPAQQYDSRVEERMRELGQNLRLKGFRPGKIPAKVLEQRYGSQVRNEALSDVIGRSFEQAVSDNKLRVAMAPRIKTNKVEKGGEIEFEATFEILPEIGEIDISNLELTRINAKVEDGDVDNMIETLRQQRKSWKPVDRAGAEGDMVLFELSAQSEDVRYPAEGSERLGTIIGSGGLFQSLEEALVGLKANDSKNVSLTFPEHFRDASIAGKTAQSTLTCVRVQEGEVPSLDTTFISSFGVAGGDLEQFRKDVRANLERELHNAILMRSKSEATEKLVQAFESIEMPVGMIEAEARAMLRQIQENARRQGGEATGLTVEALRPQARNRMLAAFLLGEIARQNKMPLDVQRLRTELASIASTYEEPEQVMALYNRDPQLMNALRNRVMEDQVVDWLIGQAKVTERKLGFAEVMQMVRA